MKLNLNQRFLRKFSLLNLALLAGLIPSSSLLAQGNSVLMSNAVNGGIITNHLFHKVLSTRNANVLRDCRMQQYGAHGVRAQLYVDTPVGAPAMMLASGQVYALVSGGGGFGGVVPVLLTTEQIAALAKDMSYSYKTAMPYYVDQEATTATFVWKPSSVPHNTKIYLITNATF